jgi:hypothetical protein
MATVHWRNVHTGQLATFKCTDGIASRLAAEVKQVGHTTVSVILHHPEEFMATNLAEHNLKIKSLKAKADEERKAQRGGPLQRVPRKGWVRLQPAK